MRTIRLDQVQQFAAINLLSDPGAIAGPVVIPSCAQFKLYWMLESGKNGHNIFYGRYTGAFAGSPAQVTSILTGLSSGAQWTALAAFLATPTVLTRLTVKDVNTAGNAEIINTAGGAAGSSASPSLPNEVALAITLTTARVGPQNRGRMFIPGWATNALGSGNVAAAAAVTALTNWAGLFNTLLAAQGYTFVLGQRARAAYTSPITGRDFPARAATSLPITQAACRDNHWDSARRRGLKQSELAQLMARGFVWAVYISDNPIRRFARLVDGDQVLDPARGWTTTGIEDLTPFPRASRPRTVYGTSTTTGRRGSTVVGSTTAPLWLGSTTSFSVEANDQTTDVMEVTHRIGERIRHFPAGPQASWSAMSTNLPTGIISLFLHPPIGTMVREQLPNEPYSGLVSVNRPRGLAPTDAFGIRFLLLSLPPGYGQTPVAGLTETDRRVVTITVHHQLADGDVIVSSSSSFSNVTDMVIFQESFPHHVELEFAPGVTARLWWILVLQMVMSAIGPLNNIWGPGLAFDVQTDQPVSGGFGQTWRVTFTAGATDSIFELVAEASAGVRGDGTGTLVIGRGPITQAGAYRTGQSAGGEVFLHIHRQDNASNDLEPPQTVGPVTWDPSLVLFKLLSGTNQGGLTPDQAQMLIDIFNSVAKVYRNAP